MKITTKPYQLSPRLRRRRGNVMAVVMATIFVLTTLVLGLHHQQSVARASQMRSEAELRFREARKFALREHVLGESAPWGLEMGAELTDITPETSKEIEENYAKQLFKKEDGGWSGLPDLSNLESAHAHRFFSVRPTGFGGLSSGVRKGGYTMVETEIPGYAAYAPNGEVQLGQVLGWQNPDYDKGGDSTEAYSGVPAFVAAQGNIDIEELAYGEAHTLVGQVDIEDGAGLGFAGGEFPLPQYENDFLASLSDARSTLIGSSATGNKTGLINQKMGIGQILSLMFGGDFNPEGLLSLRQAWQFPTPMIPGASIVVPGLVWEVWFHVPFQPDLGFSSKHDPDLSRLSEISKEQEDAGKLLEEASKKLKQAQEARDAAQLAYSSNPSDANKDSLEDAQDKYEDAKDKFEILEKFLEDSSEEAADLVLSKSQGGMSSLPQTRAEDPTGKKGQYGWNYSKTTGKMLDLVAAVVKGGSLEEVAGSISSEVRVVHYGPEDEVPGFSWNGNSFVSRSTWTVPPSRTFRFDADMQINGDLWLQRGTVMVVNGDLTVQSPNATPSLTNSFAPSGRVFFEEGSTLIVSGDFRCGGSTQFGSIMVGGEPGEVHPITSSLLVEGDIHIPHGVYAGHTIPDLIRAIDFPGVEQGAAQVEQLFGQQAPLLSKLTGPFHMRNPYFARFATTFQFITIPFPPAVVITPVPSPKENLHVFAFRAETFAYTAALNATLGENLYPQADWWPFGNGVVPMALNLNLAEAITAAGEARALAESAELDPEVIETEVRDFVETLTTRSLKWAIDEGLKKLTAEAARILTPGGFGPIVDSITALMNELEKDEDAADKFYQNFVKKFEQRVAGHGKELLSDLLESTSFMDQDDYLRNYAGLLVYGRNIFVDSDARQVSGMFVAEQDITIDADLTIGTLLSRNGSIRTGDFLYYPFFNQASLYLPAPVPGANAIERATFEAYGAAHDSGLAVQVGPPPVTRRVTTGGWDK